ncbi:S-layer homology domain-containing protein [Paenibacillus sp. 1P07SE]|uniref:S-layer homology domain-containing protein n=1 Tax=Paenibacillus sp. 1P07SE TaxID=3132209 RepID=UPI0039A5CDEF
MRLSKVKNVLAAILVIVMLAVPAAAYAAPDMTLQASSNQVQRGGEITLSGTVPDGTGEVVIKVMRPDGTIFFLDVADIVNSRYTTTVGIPTQAELSPLGAYTALAGYGSQQATASFSVVVPAPGGGIYFPGPVMPEEEEDQEQQPGEEIAGSVIKPAADGDGIYKVSSAAITQAKGENGSAVTIELPAASAGAIRVELAAAALQELSAGGHELVLQAGGLTMRFPAGAIAAGGDSVRITLDTAWAGEVRSAVEAAARSGEAYRATGVVVDVVIERIAGGVRSVIRTLTHPVGVELTLTSEQQPSLNADLAGIYYVNGQNLEYVKVGLTGGKAAFTTDHFSTYALLEYDKRFADMAGHWAELPVKALAAKHIVTGVDEQHYRPSVSITRADFVTLIMRAMAWQEGAEQTAASHDFTDVPAGRYYTEHVAAAAELGIVNGYNGQFRPQDQITRQEAAAALVRASQYFDVRSAMAGTLPFADQDEISGWAVSLVEQAWSLGLIEGDAGRFLPLESVTRAQVAVMINRLLSNS